MTPKPILQSFITFKNITDIQYISYFVCYFEDFVYF